MHYKEQPSERKKMKEKEKGERPLYFTKYSVQVAKQLRLIKITFALLVYTWNLVDVKNSTCTSL